MNKFNVIWYGAFGLVVFPLGIVISLVTAVSSHGQKRIALVILTVVLWGCGKVSLRKMREELRRRS